MIPRFGIYLVCGLLCIALGYLIHPENQAPAFLSAPAKISHHDTLQEISRETTIVTRGRIVHIRDTVHVPRMSEIPCPPETIRVTLPLMQVKNAGRDETAEKNIGNIAPQEPVGLHLFIGGGVEVPFWQMHTGEKAYSLETGVNISIRDITIDLIPLKVRTSSAAQFSCAEIRGRWVWK